MAIFRRFMTVVKSNLNHLIGKAENPEKMLNQMLLDMQEQLINAKQQVAVAIADEKRLRKQYESEKSLAIEWEKKAMLAINAGNDDLAKRALERQAAHNKQAKGFEEQWTAQKNAVEQLKTALSKLNDKINEAKRNKNLLVARAKRAEAQKTIASTMSGISNTGALDTIARMEEKIDNMEAEAQATSELAGEIAGDSLSKEFDKLEVLEADDALSKLKAKMGVSAPKQLGEGSQQSLREIEEAIDAEVSLKR